jgi:hypothetical protein
MPKKSTASPLEKFFERHITEAEADKGHITIREGSRSTIEAHFARVEALEKGPIPAQVLARIGLKDLGELHDKDLNSWCLLGNHLQSLACFEGIKDNLKAAPATGPEHENLMAMFRDAQKNRDQTRAALTRYLDGRYPNHSSAPAET